MLVNNNNNNVSSSLVLARPAGAHLHVSEGAKECQHPWYRHRGRSQHSPAAATHRHNPGESVRTAEKFPHTEVRLQPQLKPSLCFPVSDKTD